MPSNRSPWATRLDIDVRRAGTNDPIPSGEDLIGCRIVSGLESAALYYFDGDPEHQLTETIGEVEYTWDAAFQSVSLDVNAGGAGIWLISSAVVAPASDPVVVRCSVSDPQSGKEVSAEIRIVVGGAATGRPSQAVLSSTAPNLIHVPGYGPSQRVVQVRLVDEAGQPVANPPAGRANLLASIWNDPNSAADDGALLRSGASSGKTVAVSTINGQAQFTIVGGSTPGWLFVDFYADRADNDVTNGITEVVYNYASQPVIFSGGESALAITTETLSDAYVGAFYSAFIGVSGGFPPYIFELGEGSSLPEGLSFSSDGVITGIPLVEGDKFTFVVKVTDVLGFTVSRIYELNVKATGGAGLTIKTESLPGGTEGTAYNGLLQAAGGKLPYTWSQVGSSPFTVSGTGIGVVSGTAVAGTYTVIVKVVDGNGIEAVKSFTVTIAQP